MCLAMWLTKEPVTTQVIIHLLHHRYLFSSVNRIKINYFGIYFFYNPLKSANILINTNYLVIGVFNKKYLQYLILTNLWIIKSI